MKSQGAEVTFRNGATCATFIYRPRPDHAYPHFTKTDYRGCLDEPSLAAPWRASDMRFSASAVAATIHQGECQWSATAPDVASASRSTDAPRGPLDSGQPRTLLSLHDGLEISVVSESGAMPDAFGRYSPLTKNLYPAFAGRLVLTAAYASQPDQRWLLAEDGETLLPTETTCVESVVQPETTESRVALRARCEAAIAGRDPASIPDDFCERIENFSARHAMTPAL